MIARGDGASIGMQIIRRGCREIPCPRSEAHILIGSHLAKATILAAGEASLFPPRTRMPPALFADGGCETDPGCSLAPRRTIRESSSLIAWKQAEGSPHSEAMTFMNFQTSLPLVIRAIYFGSRRRLSEWLHSLLSRG